MAALPSRLAVRAGPLAALLWLAVGTTAAQGADRAGTGAQGASTIARGSPASSSVDALPADYLIGPDDVLSIVFWREKDISADVVVRPDGRISLPLLNDVQAAGLTPEQLRVVLDKAAEKYLEDPRATVVVKQINSRRVFITGQVAKQGPYPLMSGMTVMQLITVAGGLLDFADEDNISVVRKENGRNVSYRFNYSEVKRRRNLTQNIELKPGDTVIVP